MFMAIKEDKIKHFKNMFGEKYIFILLIEMN
jgi:hypothetical protein